MHGITLQFYQLATYIVKLLPITYFIRDTIYVEIYALLQLAMWIINICVEIFIY